MLDRNLSNDSVYGAADRNVIPTTSEVQPSRFPITFDRILRPVKALRTEIFRKLLKVFLGGRSLQHSLVDYVPLQLKNMQF